MDNNAIESKSEFRGLNKGAVKESLIGQNPFYPTDPVAKEVFGIAEACAEQIIKYVEMCNGVPKDLTINTKYPIEAVAVCFMTEFLGWPCEKHFKKGMI